MRSDDVWNMSASLTRIMYKVSRTFDLKKKIQEPGAIFWYPVLVFSIKILFYIRVISRQIFFNQIKWCRSDREYCLMERFVIIIIDIKKLCFCF